MVKPNQKGFALRCREIAADGEFLYAIQCRLAVSQRNIDIPISEYLRWVLYRVERVDIAKLSDSSRSSNPMHAS
jgi:hypothetical protein